MRKKREESYITIKDVALAAGVSIATVSRVMNNGVVSYKRKKKVLDVIKELNYIPNSSARNLASVNSTKRVVLVVPDIGKNYYVDIIRGATDILKTYAYDIKIDPYYDQSNYNTLNENYIKTSEYKGIITLGTASEIENKITIDWNNELIRYKNKEKKDVAVYSEDKIIKSFLLKNFNLKNFNEQLMNDHEEYLAPSLEDALRLYNLGIRKTIYTFANTDEIKKIISNIKTIYLDFYGIGAVLARIVMKKIQNLENKEVIFELRRIDV